ncbi:hypothetical protein [Lacipirellula parvula]|nr:hypothetical protein [Lacipirellula parvula]
MPNGAQWPAAAQPSWTIADQKGVVEKSPVGGVSDADAGHHR